MATVQPTDGHAGFAAHGRGVLASHPNASELPDRQALVTCMEACADCAQACLVCADACLGEPNVAELITCIRLNQDCADLCAATGSLLARQTSLDWELAGAALEACLIACDKCANECARHASHMEHCRICETACRACKSACDDLLTETSSAIA